MQRDRALFETYTRALQERHFASPGEAINYVRKHPAPRFYIDGNFCAIIIGRMLKGQPTGLKGKQRERKFKELFRLYLIEAEKPENKGMPKREICSRIVEMPAPEFYLNYRATNGILTAQRNLKVREMERWTK